MRMSPSFPVFSCIFIGERGGRAKEQKMTEVEKFLPFVRRHLESAVFEAASSEEQLQALSMARDLTIFGERQNVSVIRERNGERVIYEVNLCDVDLFKSPAYYLQQNDVVYVQPNENKARQSTVDDKSLRMTSIFVSGGSLIVSLATFITSLVLNHSR